MDRKLRLVASAAAQAVGAVSLGTLARAVPAGVKVGVLTCNVDSGWGFVFGSSHSLRCNYSPRPDHAEHYIGNVSKFGVDIGYSGAGVIVWTVIAPTTDLAPGSLAGNYGGVTGGASVGIGADESRRAFMPIVLGEKGQAVGVVFPLLASRDG